MTMLHSHLCPGWEVDKELKELKPLVQETGRVIDFLAARPGDDLDVRFIFDGKFSAVDMHIVQSRLEWAGGALKELATVEEREVILGKDDDDRSFRVLRRYLYTQEVLLGDMGVVELMEVVCVAHRWGLWELVRVICDYVREMELLNGNEDEEGEWVEGVVKAVAVVKLEEVGHAFIKYFWECVGRRFEDFVRVKGRKRWGENGGEGTWSGFPGLWDLALEQGMVKRVLECARGRVGGETMEEFLEVVIVYLEPKMPKDEDVSDLLEVLGKGVLPYGRRVVAEDVLDHRCSVRAMRLLASSVLGRNHRLIEVRRRGKKLGVKSGFILSLQLLVLAMIRQVRDGAVSTVEDI